MKREEFKKLVSERKLFLDGATGSNLQKRGLPEGVCPEKWILENADVMKQLQKEYIAAGTDILYAPTFTGNRIKLAEYGLEGELKEINEGLIKLSKSAIKEFWEENGASNGDSALGETAGADGKNGASNKIPYREILVAGDLTMTGRQVEPVGNMPFEELIEVYKEQAKVLCDAGADLIVVETMMSLQECRAAVIAVHEVCELPVMVTLTFNEDGRALFGTNPETAALVMSAMGVDAVGMNCSTGPSKMVPWVKQMAEYTDVPIVVKPNAGMPELVNGETVYPMTPEIFADEMYEIVMAGADIIGGCCGTTPLHIEKLYEKVSGELTNLSWKERVGKVVKRALSTERNVLPIDLDGRFMIIGERINPTGKKKLQEELRAGKLNLVGEMAESQVLNGADILDVNMGTNGIDEKEMMIKCINELTTLVDAPLSLDSSNMDVLEAALRLYPGRALINSISLEDGKCERLLPAAKKYGAMFILLPLNSEGLPKDLNEKKENIDTILAEAKKYGLSKDDIIIDGLVATIGAQPRAAIETLETINYAKNGLGIATACGLSNISFGLPDRMYVNSNFMAMAIMTGLTMAIANPSQELLMHAVMASDLLMNKPKGDERYITRATEHKISVIEGSADELLKAAGAGTGSAVSKPKNSSAIPDEFADNEIYAAVVKGKKDAAVELTKKETEKDGFNPKDILDNSLIPAITQVGALYEKQIYYLPQLISAAEAMSSAVEILEPFLGGDGAGDSKGTVVIATVEHDIHDIGKNLVALMLKNYGFNVIDLGKDVPAEDIIKTAKEENADIIGLSALMTTTMMEMKKVVDLVHAEGLNCKVMIGGACITESFAKEIGADGYSEDAQEAVKVAENLMGN
ncbi:MAG: homocysteine S-methyltransferase family protein [Lachnospiraceae bacterium]|nr:homocysteine S-methyltransferase family protein [Lachnospiraceae bacterium]